MATRKTPAVTEVFDLDAARAQRLEAGKPDKFTFTFSGREYHMPLELKLSVLRKLKKLDADDVEGSFDAILGEGQAAAFFEADPTLQDLTALYEAYQNAVGLDVGKSSGSDNS